MRIMCCLPTGTHSAYRNKILAPHIEPIQLTHMLAHLYPIYKRTIIRAFNTFTNIAVGILRNLLQDFLDGQPHDNKSSWFLCWHGAPWL